MIDDLGGDMPEELPAAPPIKTIESRLRRQRQISDDASGATGEGSQAGAQNHRKARGQ